MKSIRTNPTSIRRDGGAVYLPLRNDGEPEVAIVPRGKRVRSTCPFCGGVVTARVGSNHHGTLAPLLVRCARPGRCNTFRSTGLFAHSDCIRRLFDVEEEILR